MDVIRPRALARLAFALLGLASCIDTGPGPQGKKIEAAYIAANLLKAAPPTVTHLDVDLGGKVVYLGNTIDRTSVAPGGVVHITHYWQVKAPLGPGWRVFAFVRGAPAVADFMYLDPTDMELGHPTQSWQPGQIIQDTMDIVLRPDWRSPTATLYVGVIQVGGHDLGDRMVATGPKVVDRAIVARTFDVDLSRAPPPLGTIHIPHATSPITIDGLAGEPAWSGAVTSPELVTAEGSSDPIGHATARMTWDEQFLYVFVQVTDTDITSPYKVHDEPLWKADAIELFIDADSNRHGYVELQVNPNNATFDSWFATTRAQPGDEKWDSGMVTAVKVRGTTEPGDTDQGWDVEIGIPWAAVKGRDDAMAVRLPPQVGDRWRLNLVRVDYKTGGGAGTSSWNRITNGDFHALDRMLTAVFADSTGLVVPRPPDAAGSGSAAGSGAAAGGGSGSAGAGSGAAGAGSAAPRGPGSAAIIAPALAPQRQVVPIGAINDRTIAPQGTVPAHGSASQPPAPAAGSAAGSAVPPRPAQLRVPAGSAAAPGPQAKPAATKSETSTTPSAPLVVPSSAP